VNHQEAAVTTIVSPGPSDGPVPDTRSKDRPRRSSQVGATAGGGAVYGIGLLGAIVYFLGAASTGWDYLLALPKAVLWPALLVYEAFTQLSS
jgi:hypothetical protein